MLYGSQNCRGLRYKADSLKLLLQRNNLDILLMQETHVENLKIGKSIEKQLDGKIFWSFGPNNARGVGVYIKNHLKTT